MYFSVIISVDGPREALKSNLPRKSLRKRLNGDLSESEYRYLGEESGDPKDPWHKALEWKGSGILTRSEFHALLDDLGAFAEQCETQGSMGGPLGFGLVPDVAFRSDEPSVIVSLRATPIFGGRLDNARDEEDAVRKWERLRQAMWRQFATDKCSHFTKVPLRAREKWQERFPAYGDAYAKTVQRERAKMRRDLAEAAA